MMNASPLHLDSYIFVEDTVSCRFGERHPDTAPEIDREHLEFEVRTVDNESRKGRNHALVNIKVSTKEPDEDFDPHYSFAFEVVCSISVSLDYVKDLSDDRIEEILVMNASNLMFGAIRERLNSKTGSMMWGSLCLPLVSFDGLKRINKADSE